MAGSIASGSAVGFVEAWDSVVCAGDATTVAIAAGAAVPRGTDAPGAHPATTKAAAITHVPNRRNGGSFRWRPGQR
jgi:hypothetical protein